MLSGRDGISTNPAKVIDLRQSVISEDLKHAANNISQTTATGQKSLDAEQSLSDHKKKIVEQFQMSVMRNELKKNLKLRNSQFHNVFENSVNEFEFL